MTVTFTCMLGVVLVMCFNIVSQLHFTYLINSAPFSLSPAASQCEVDNGGCAHFCTETIDSYTCSCYPGYTVDTDEHNCTGGFYQHNE